VGSLFSYGYNRSYVRREWFVLTASQSIACIVQCQALTNMFRSIHILRLDETLNAIFVLADEDIVLLVYPDGNWSFA
jgi:hypothetical protein